MVYQHLTKSEIAQIRNIIGSNPHKALDILRDCAEISGLTSKAEYSKVMCISLRTVQDGCKKESIISLDINGDKFPCVNCNL